MTEYKDNFKYLIYLMQKRVIRLLQKNNKNPLNIVSKDNCSEMSRLVGCWIIKKIPQIKIYILKGINIQNTNLNHDIIACEYDEKIDLIDPTIWQKE